MQPHGYVRAHACVCACVRMCVNAWMCVCVNVWICVNAYVCVNIYECMCENVCEYLWMYMNVCVCMCECMCKPTRLLRSTSGCHYACIKSCRQAVRSHPAAKLSIFRTKIANNLFSKTWTCTILLQYLALIPTNIHKQFGLICCIHIAVRAICGKIR